MTDITVIKGNLPLILLSPHGGFMDLDEIPNRNETFKCSSKSGKCHKNKKTAFVTQNDGPLTEIAHFIYVTINKLTGKMPYMVINNIARHDLDVNRPCYDGAEVDHAEDIWNKYFSNIDNLVLKELYILWGNKPSFFNLLDCPAANKIPLIIKVCFQEMRSDNFYLPNIL